MYVWDQATGVSVEGTSKQPGYSMKTIVEATNMWQPSACLDQAILVLVAVSTALVAVVLIVLAILLKKKKSTK